jgi:ABC-type transport system substrate-binding protein
VTTSYSFAYRYMLFNFSAKAPAGIGRAVRDPAVRQALQMGVHQAAIIHDISDGYAEPCDGSVTSLPATHDDNLQLALAQSLPVRSRGGPAPPGTGGRAAGGRAS